jgi:hypothetical protein
VNTTKEKGTRGARPSVAMKPEWNAVPAEPLKLRETLPRISGATQERLIAWVTRQPDVMSWLLQRTAAYWGRLMDQGSTESHPTVDELHRLTDATAALDLLEWQSGCRGKAAIDWLAGLDEAGEFSTTNGHE